MVILTFAFQETKILTRDELQALYGPLGTIPIIPNIGDMMRRQKNNGQGVVENIEEATTSIGKKAEEIAEKLGTVNNSSRGKKARRLFNQAKRFLNKRF
jgi:hypothetical protein